MPNNIHDALFKSTFSQVEHAVGELKSLLPAALSDRIDFTTLTLVPGTFVDEELAERHTDLLFSANIDETHVLLYLLYEHQSRVEALMAFRLLVYMVRIWEDFLKNHPGSVKLPVIVPVVLHHSATGWTASLTFEELLDADPATLAGLGEHAVRFRFVIDDISRESDERLMARAMSAFGRLVLWCLKGARAPRDLVEGIRAWTGVLRETKAAPNGRAALATLWRYILAASERFNPEEPAKTVITQLLAAVEEDAKEDLMTFAEALHEDGRKEGILQGRLEGQKDALLTLLGARFGALPDEAITKIRAAGAGQLEDWLKRGGVASTLGDVLYVS